MPLTIGIIGDFNASITAHRANPLAVELAASACKASVQARWLPTDGIRSSTDLHSFDGLWCVPGSPYRSMDGALLAIRYAREMRIPFLGTCGGFQHAVIEYARNVLGWTDADHAETAPDAACAVISLLACALVEVNDRIKLQSGSRIAQAYGCNEITEGYHCRYGLNESFRRALTGGSLHEVAHDEQREVRAVELEDHPFFVATLFQPERAALAGTTPPLVRAFIQSMLTRSS